MKVQPFKRYNVDDYKDAEKWFLTFLTNINQMIDSLNPFVANGVDISNNLTAERQEVMLSHGVPVKLTMRTLKRQPNLVRVGYAAGYVGSAAITAYNTDGTVSVTVYFQDPTPPTVPVSTTLVLEP